MSVWNAVQLHMVCGDWESLQDGLIVPVQISDTAYFLVDWVQWENCVSSLLYYYSGMLDWEIQELRMPQLFTLWKGWVSEREMKRERNGERQTVRHRIGTRERERERNRKRGRGGRQRQMETVIARGGALLHSRLAEIQQKTCITARKIYENVNFPTSPSEGRLNRKCRYYYCVMVI